MATAYSIAKKWANEVEQDLTKEYTSQGREASGEWSKELSNEIVTDGESVNVKIYGANYTLWMEQGRKPNKKQDKKSLRAFAGYMASAGGPIFEWCKSKNIATTYAFPIAYNLGVNGYEGKPLVSNVLTSERIAELVEELGLTVLDNIKSDVISMFKK
jgi:hypothetical protein